jgi:GntR family transcriptional regulator
VYSFEPRSGETHRVWSTYGDAMLDAPHPDDVPPFEPRPAAYVYAEMANHLALRIRARDLRPGARLPGERDLAEEYGVAVGTARRAVEELRERGLAVTLPGKGTYVTATAGEDSPDQ